MSCYDYSWIDNRTIVYNLNAGIKVLDVVENKDKTLIKDVSSLRKIADFYKVCGDIEKVLQAGDLQGLIVNEVRKPKYYNGRVFFEVFACTKSNKVIGVLSINKDLTNLCQHFISEQGLITDYYIIDEATIAVDIKRNNLVNENIKSGLRYYSNNIEVKFDGFKPLQFSKFPTELDNIIIEQSKSNKMESKFSLLKRIFKK